jgi:hypothetical protein
METLAELCQILTGCKLLEMCVATFAAKHPMLCLTPLRRFARSRAASGTKTYFDVFSLPACAVLPVADRALQQQYHALQGVLHPDQAGVQQQAAEQRGGAGVTACSHDSTVVNEAYHALRGNYSRCRYLSRLVRSARVRASPPAGVVLKPVAADHVVSADDVTNDLEGDRSFNVDGEFLGGIMEFNEVVFEADAATPEGRAALDKAAEEIDALCDGKWQRCQELVAEGGAALRGIAACHGEAGLPEATVAEGAFHRTVMEWTYYHNLKGHLAERK